MPFASSLRRIVLIVALGLSVGTLAPASPLAAKTPMATTASIVFLHHSTGYVIWEGGVPEWFAAYNAANGTSYSITDVSYPGGGYPWDNYPWDYWNIWVNHAGTTAYLGQSTLEMLTPQYDVIVFKHCFPVCSIESDTEPDDVTSSFRTIGNYKLQYEALKTKMREFPSTRFIVWTGAARLATEVPAIYAARADTFFDWVVNEWDEPGDNIFVWDFFELETEGGLYLLPEYSSGDSHPNATFAAAVAPLFAQRVVDVIEGTADLKDTTDVPDSDGGLSFALASANPGSGPVRLGVSLPAAARIELSIYDTAGRRVTTVASGEFGSGPRTFTWDHHVAGVGAGIYFARLRAAGRTLTRRIVIVG